MKIQCYNCKKIFEDKEITILLDYGDYAGTLSGCWHIPFCKKCLKECKEDFEKEQ